MKLQVFVDNLLTQNLLVYCGTRNIMNSQEIFMAWYCVITKKPLSCEEIAMVIPFLVLRLLACPELHGD